MGLTLITATKKQPHRAWAQHLAGFGAQASIVAGSPYYKLLIGRVCGYKEPNILHHINVRVQRRVQLVQTRPQHTSELGELSVNM